MSIAELFKRALVRRLVVVLVAAALAWVGIGRAEAATIPPPTCNSTGAAGNTHYCTREQAYNACDVSKGNAIAAGYSPASCAAEGNPAQLYRCTNVMGQCSTNIFRFPNPQCPVDKPWDEATKTCKQTCSVDDPPLSGGWITGDYYRDTTMSPFVCSNSCRYIAPEGSTGGKAAKVDGVWYTQVTGFEPTGAACSAGESPLGDAPAQDSDGDGVSDANDPAPNNPGDSGGNGPDAPDGQGNGDGDGSGNGNKSSGGGDCASQPSSSGDQILANSLLQQWKMRCLLESALDGNGNVKTKEAGSSPGGGDGDGEGDDTTAGGGRTCTAPPTCGGHAAICAVYSQIWMLRCLDDGKLAGVEDQPEVQQAHDFFTVEDALREDYEEALSEKAEFEKEDLWADEDEEGNSVEDLLNFDETGFLGGGSCPVGTTVSIGNGAIPFSFGPLCELFISMSSLVMGLAWFVGIRIVAGAK